MVNQHSMSTGVVVWASSLFNQSESPDPSNLSREKRVIARSKVTPPHSFDHDVYFVCREGVLTVEKWKFGLREFERATIYPNEVAVYIPAGWFYVLVNPNPKQTVEVEIFHFQNKS